MSNDKKVEQAMKAFSAFVENHEKKEEKILGSLEDQVPPPFKDMLKAIKAKEDDPTIYHYDPEGLLGQRQDQPFKTPKSSPKKTKPQHRPAEPFEPPPIIPFYPGHYLEDGPVNELQTLDIGKLKERYFRLYHNDTEKNVRKGLETAETRTDEQLKQDRQFIAGLEKKHLIDPDQIEFQVEDTLSQAVQFFTAVEADYELLQDLEEKRTSLMHELEEYFQLTAIHKKEVKAGFYTVPQKRAELLRDAEREIQSGHRTVYDRYHWLYTKWLTESRMSDYARAIAKGPMLSSLPLDKNPKYWDLPDYKPGDFNFNPFISENKLPDMLYALHIRAATPIAQSFRASAYQVMHSAKAGMGAATRRMNAHDRDAKWAEKDSDFRRERTEAANKYMELRLLEATRKNGSLNYAERITKLRDRIKQNLKHGLSYYAQAKQGLETIFDIGLEEPKNYYKGWDRLWQRRERLINAQEELNAFMYRDQSFVMPISLKSIFKQANGDDDTTWEEGLEKGEWDLDLLILKLAWVEQMQYARLQGVSAFVESKSDDFWNVTVKPPENGIYNHQDASWPGVSQEHIPPAIISRATTRNTIRQPDMVGINAFHNVAPWGGSGDSGWKIELSDTSHKGAKRSAEEIDDVELDIHVAMRLPTDFTL